MEIAFWCLVAAVGTGVTWYGSGLLEGASERLAVYHGLPPIVQGSMVAAVGSSFPELSSAVLATLVHGDFELGVAAIAGSAIFNITVIPAIAAYLSADPLSTNRDLVYKEAQFYMVSVALLLLVFSLAVIYEPVPGMAGLEGRFTRGLALIPLLAYGLYVFMQWQDTMDYEPEVDPGEVRPAKQWALLILSLVVVLAGVEGIVRAAVRMGELMGTPSTLWGITVVAAGTSLPDAFYSVQAVRKGNAVSSMANVLGSNVFDLLVAVPAGVLIGGAVVIDFSAAVPVFAGLTLITVVLFTFMRTRLVLARWEGSVLLALYVAFLVWMFSGAVV